MKRGCELLEVGGRLVYSTCSLNPIEDEAVVAEMLRVSKGAMKLVDISDAIPNLKYTKGVSKWKVSLLKRIYLSVIPIVRLKPEIRLFRHFPKFRPKSIQRKAGKVLPDKKKRKNFGNSHAFNLAPHH